jgi:hypothetical protein
VKSTRAKKQGKQLLYESRIMLFEISSMIRSRTSAMSRRILRSILKRGIIR